MAGQTEDEKDEDLSDEDLINDPGNEDPGSLMDDVLVPLLESDEEVESESDDKG